MPSVVIGQGSGPQQIISGNPWSGQQKMPRTGVQLRLARNASGEVYVGLSGGVTANSGGSFASGASGMLDGFPLGPGDSYFVPAYAFGVSGTYNLFARWEAAASGQARLYYEAF